MHFNKQGYAVLKNAIDKKLALFLYDYLLLKRKVATHLFKKNYFSPYDNILGSLSDTQVPETYCSYSDIAMENLLINLKPLMEKIVKFKLVPTYSYTRAYKKGDILKRHKDRPSCEISTTLNLGGDPWPIFIDGTGSNNVIDEYKNIHKPNAPKGTKITLKPGDMLIYKGCDLEHWREAFKGKDCVQTFLHYNRASKPNNNKFDGRPFLGLPSYFNSAPK